MKLIYAAFIACVVLILSGIALVVSVIGEIDWIEDIGLFFLFTSAFVTVVGFFAALFQRKWKWLFGLLAAQIVAFAIALFCALLCKLGERNPPHQDDETDIESFCDSLEVCDSLETY